MHAPEADLEPPLLRGQRFVEEYIIDRNAVRAYRAVFGADQSYTSAASAASRLAKRINVAAEIRSAEEHLRERCGITAELKLNAGS